MSTHDTHPTSESKGIWTLPLIVVILSLFAAWFFTRDTSHAKHEQQHGQTEEIHH